MPDYRVTFQNGRIGRSHDVAPLIVHAEDVGGLAEAVYDAARPHLLSRYPEVVIDQPDEDGPPVGLVFAGFHTVARFSIEEVVPA